MIELVAGANRSLPDGALSVHVAGPFDLSLLITSGNGKVAGDGDFVFYNQPSAPGARLTGDGASIDPPRLRPAATRVVVVVSPADTGATLGQLPPPVLNVRGRGGTPVARFTPPRPRQETVLLLAEIYQRGAGWKIRALGQGYSDGLAGLVRDFGVQVNDDDGAAPAGPPMTPPPPPPPAPARPAASSAAGAAVGGGTRGADTGGDIVSQVVALVNVERGRLGQRPLTVDVCLLLVS
ncbi:MULTISPECIES: TerD family protein [Protofrankia]|uniref:Stress protein n=1 Tax=Candidatus Protofrankia datiscae TaxID=2716812 RepID=F8B603_9ACTN|nr:MULTISPECIES: TerD family protein [Protofrankia]AEH11152.1 stress protein [Candidatus Protofrankia datiscae]